MPAIARTTEDFPEALRPVSISALFGVTSHDSPVTMHSPAGVTTVTSSRLIFRSFVPAYVPRVLDVPSAEATVWALGLARAASASWISSSSSSRAKSAATASS